jgi:hypothetical protein
MRDPVLSAGKATPGTGTTATVFTFSVTYSDAKGCAPNWVRVTVNGVGTFPMTGGGTSYDTGVTFTRALKLPAGTHTYSFAASSGEGAGLQTTTLTSVSPPSVVVTVAPTPSPEPTPTPTTKPTPPPTPVPTPRPTPVPTTAPTPVPPTAGATATPPSSPSPGGGSGSSSHAPSPTDVAGGVVSPTGGPGASEVQGQAPGASGSEAGGEGSFGRSDGMGSFALLLGAWATATAAGLAFFLVLAPRRRAPNQPAFADATQAAADAPAPRPSGEPSMLATDVPPDEVNMPRWLRPSVQAARRGQRESRSSDRRFED